MGRIERLYLGGDSSESTSSSSSPSSSSSSASPGTEETLLDGIIAKAVKKAVKEALEEGKDYLLIFLCIYLFVVFSGWKFVVWVCPRLLRLCLSLCERWKEGRKQIREKRLLILGLDNAGKTTLLQMLKNDKESKTLPSYCTTRRVWKDYFPSANAIVFLIDASDHERFNEAFAEINSLLTDEQLRNCPVLILGNKIDNPGAASEAEIGSLFGLQGQTTGKGIIERSTFTGRPLELFMCSVLKRQGYGIQMVGTIFIGSFW